MANILETIANATRLRLQNVSLEEMKRQALSLPVLDHPSRKH